MNTKKSIGLQTIIALNPEIVRNTIDSEVVIMSLAKNNYFRINKIGSHIWELLKTPITLEEINKVMMAQYNVEPEICRKDVLQFIEEVLKLELIMIQE